MSKRLPPHFDVTIKKLVPSGEGLGHFENRRIFVYGVMPEDQVRVRPVKVGRYAARAAVVDILEASPLRRAPQDEHFAISSPWQIMPEEKQLEYKKALAKEIFQQKAGRPPFETVEITPSPENWHYRNKMEFCFAEDSEGKLTIAAYERARFNSFVPLKVCHLAHKKINTCLARIMDILNEKKVSCRQLKNIVIRYSYYEDKCIAVLYAVDKDFSCFDVAHEDLEGWTIVFSDPLSPAAKTTKVLYHTGRDFLIEKMGGLFLKYYYDSFFQISPPAFEEVLSYVNSHVEPYGKGNLLVDLYAGVGTIGFYLADKFREVYSIEYDGRSTEAAQDNARKNSLKNVTLISDPAERTDLRNILSKADVLILDPPRSGLHPKALRAIVAHAPPRLVYVSCNPKTQAQDFASLQGKYKAVKWRLFDLHPQTPHVESVLILERS